MQAAGVGSYAQGEAGFAHGVFHGFVEVAIGVGKGLDFGLQGGFQRGFAAADFGGGFGQRQGGQPGVVRVWAPISQPAATKACFWAGLIISERGSVGSAARSHWL